MVHRIISSSAITLLMDQATPLPLIDRNNEHEKLSVSHPADVSTQPLQSVQPRDGSDQHERIVGTAFVLWAGAGAGAWRIAHFSRLDGADFKALEVDFAAVFFT
jgi:hypothetical protein